MYKWGVYGKNYRSQSEKEFASDLSTNKIDFTYEDFRITYVVKKHYIPDFYLPEYDFYIEYKGYFKSSDRTKHLLVQKQSPDLDIRFVFQNSSNKLSKKSKTTYADWCDRYNFKWAEGKIPNTWLKIKK
jgi:hypothetical protein|tara:strand:+ start:30 stop:416 length:387 start_codon:yes stop_codon:yes gene_type:complete